MLHWYRLARLEQQLKLISGRSASPNGSLSRRQQLRFFWLGLIEAAPLIAGGIFTIYTDSSEYAAIVSLIAIALTGIICWLLRRKVPPTRIDLSQARSSE
jgi:hypothetical protein